MIASIYADLATLVLLFAIVGIVLWVILRRLPQYRPPTDSKRAPPAFIRRALERREDIRPPKTKRP